MTTFAPEVAQLAEVDLRVVPRLADNAAWGENIAAVPLTNNDLRNVPTEFPVSNTDWQGTLMYRTDQLGFDR